ncbi:MAG: sulfite exporter TauE/SafE family protein [Terracidiphilus sp.]|nr:sulfite exporter TauE/SafE family protein [Terracidiphilus sp.]
MITYHLYASLGEALTLGLATGPVCLATCGPVVVPWMLAQTEGVRRQSGQLGLFLAGRLAGYLLFGVLAWGAGEAIPHTWAGRPWFLGVVDMLLGVAMVAYAAGWPHRGCAKEKEPAPLVRIGEPVNAARRGALALGFLTGVNFCPPFLTAGVRAAELNQLAGAMIFFAAFFAGTVVWFLPLAGLGLVRRSQAVLTVARLAALLLALWYGGTGLSILIAEGMRG